MRISIENKYQCPQGIEEAAYYFCKRYCMYAHTLYEDNGKGECEYPIKENLNKDKMNPTCLITGKTDNLRMYAIRSPEGNMVGWVFLHESVKMEDIEADIKWNYKVKVNDSNPT